MSQKLKQNSVWIVLFLAETKLWQQYWNAWMCCTLLNVWLLLLVYLEVWKWHNQKLTNMQYTHFLTLFFANLLLLFIYRRNKTILCILHLTNPWTFVLVPQIPKEEEHSSSLVSKLKKSTQELRCAVYLNGISKSHYPSLIWALCA